MALGAGKFLELTPLSGGTQVMKPSSRLPDCRCRPPGSSQWQLGTTPFCVLQLRAPWHPPNSSGLPGSLGPSSPQEAQCGYTIILMAIFWCTEALPLAVTALIPVLFFPLMGIMDSTKVRNSRRAAAGQGSREGLW